VHLALADSPFVRTESEGVEPERRLVVFPKAE
jgi:predicted RNA-binding protein Jag